MPLGMLKCYLKSHWCWITINLMHKQEGFIFIDRLSNVTVGAGLIREIRDNVQPTTSQYDAFEIELNQLIRRHFPHWGAKRLTGRKIVTIHQDIVWHPHQIGLKEREAQQVHKGCVLWFYWVIWLR